MYVYVTECTIPLLWTGQQSPKTLKEPSLTLRWVPRKIPSNKHGDLFFFQNNDMSVLE